MALLVLDADVTEGGMSQGDLIKVINNLITVVNELNDDHATSKTLQDELIVDHATTVTLQDEIVADHATIIAQLAEMNTDGDAVFADLTAIHAAIVGITAKLDADAGITDTNYAATWDPAALTATAIAAADTATLTAVAQATLTATAPATLAETGDVVTTKG